MRTTTKFLGSYTDKVPTNPVLASRGYSFLLDTALAVKGGQGLLRNQGFYESLTVTSGEQEIRVTGKRAAGKTLAGSEAFRWQGSALTILGLSI